jgi:hypothetical protein
MGLANAQKPATMDILAAATDFSVGHVLTPQDLVVKTVFVDDNTSLYIRADEEGTASLVNGIVVVPMFVGQPIMRTSVIADAAGSNRLSAALANYPQGGSLFPLPLDLANVIAPSTDSFLPGDLVNITVVISSRPQPPVTPTVMPEFVTGSEPYVPVAPQGRIEGQAQVGRTGTCRSCGGDKSLPGVQPPWFKLLGLETEIPESRTIWLV